MSCACVLRVCVYICDMCHVRVHVCVVYVVCVRVVSDVSFVCLHVLIGGVCCDCVCVCVVVVVCACCV